jgi:hypothetical protein
MTVLALRFVRRLAYAFFSIALLWAGSLRAQTPAPLAVVLHGDALPGPLLQAALAKELGRTVIFAEPTAGAERLTITWRKVAHELAVSYDRGARTVARVVAAPDAPEKVVDAASLLAANLLREDIAQDPVPVPVPDSPPAPAPAPAPPSALAPKPAAEVTYVPAVASLAYPLATNLFTPWARTNFEFNALYGRVGTLEGLQLGAVGLAIGMSEHKSATGEVRGAQISLLASVATGAVRGAQLGFVGNVAASGLMGLQLGGVNVAAGASKGVQLGLVNVSAGPLQGAQVGLINYAKDVDGVPIGVVSVTESGGIHPLAWASSSTFGNLGIKFATKYTYTMPYGSVHHAYDRDLVGGGGAIGARIPLHRYLRIEIDLGLTYLRAVKSTPSQLPAGTAWQEQLWQPRLRGAFHVSPVKHFSVFVGGGVVTEVRIVEDGRDAEVRVRPEIFAGLQL